MGTSSSAGGYLTQEEAAKEAIAIRMSQKFALLEDERPIIETMAYNDKYKKIIDEVSKDKEEALKEKEDHGAFIFPIRLEGKVNENALADTGSDINTMPYRIYEQLGREDIKKVDRGITMINHTQAEAMGILTNVLCQVGVTTLIAKFLILDILIDCDSPIVVGRGFLRTIGGIVNARGRLFSTFDGFCHQTFCTARSDFMRNAESDSNDEEDYQIKRNKFGAPASGTHDNEAGSSRNKRSRQHETVEEVLLPQDILNRMGCDGEIDVMLRIKVRKAESGEEIFTSVPWIRAFNINEPIYAEFCHEFYSTYEFDEVCASNELQTKKIIKFRLGGRAHSLTLLELARRLGLYQATELDEDGFNVYFEGGLHSDEHFNVQEYWLSISREENLSLSRIHASTIRYPILRVVHKMITYGLCQRTTRYDKIQKNDWWLLSLFDARHQNGYANVAWLIARWLKRKGHGSQKESQICCGQFITKLARKSRVLTNDVIRSLSSLIYCRDLDTTTRRELIDSEGRLVLEDPQPGVSRVGIPRPPRASMQDLYDRMGHMEI
ncbi:integrase, catalytic region, zinc finger, CCHC-type containing protein [Tanacetum coccineum]